MSRAAVTPAAVAPPLARVLVLAFTLMLAPAHARADADIAPRSAKDTWTQSVTDENGQPLIHSLRVAALELTNRARFRWRLGITWRFRHVLDTGMPAREDRPPMMAIDDAIHDLCEGSDDNRIVYFTTGGGIREVMLYATSEAGAWSCAAAVFKKFPDWFPGDRKKWSYVQSDPDWAAYRSIVKMLATAARPSAR